MRLIEATSKAVKTWNTLTTPMVRDLNDDAVSAVAWVRQSTDALPSIELTATTMSTLARRITDAGIRNRFLNIATTYKNAVILLRKLIIAVDLGDNNSYQQISADLLREGEKRMVLLAPWFRALKEIGIDKQMNDLLRSRLKELDRKLGL